MRSRLSGVRVAIDRAYGVRLSYAVNLHCMGGHSVKAIVHERYGPAEVLELKEIDPPVPADDEVLVRVRAASVNPVDWYGMTGRPYLGRVAFGLRRPKTGRVGTDFAGTVEAVGVAVTRFAPGDEVFGGADGAFAELVETREDRRIA